MIETDPVRELDILFVVDNSNGMFEPQQALVAGFPGLLEQLSRGDGGLPDLHIGVVSSDLGAGPYAITGCVGEGDEGRLQSQARGAACSPPSDVFISDVDDGAGGRDRNFAGTLEETFACIAPLGSAGCGFEQHLESMRRALDGSQPANAGFLRADAHLLVVVLADEDDCSTQDPAMFDPAQNLPSDPLGPLSSFRCFEFGVDCETGNADPRAPGELQGCTPREDSAFMHGGQEYVDFLRGLKADAASVSVATIVGTPEPVVVGNDPERPDNPALVPSCRSGFGVAGAAVRLTWFGAQFVARHLELTICDDGLAAAVPAVGTLASNAMATSCLTAPVAGSLEELAASCRGFDVTGLDTAAEQRTALRACGNDAVPCLRLVADDRCTLNDARASVRVERGGANPSAGTQVVVECLAPAGASR